MLCDRYVTLAFNAVPEAGAEFGECAGAFGA
jgi:hypothetical protein